MVNIRRCVRHSATASSALHVFEPRSAGRSSRWLFGWLAAGLVLHHSTDVIAAAVLPSTSRPTRQGKTQLCTQLPSYLHQYCVRDTNTGRARWWSESEATPRCCWCHARRRPGWCVFSGALLAAVPGSGALERGKPMPDPARDSALTIIRHA